MNKKSKIYLLVLIWAAVLLQLFINSSINRERRMVEQVMSEGVYNMTEGRVKAYGYYGGDELSEDTRTLIAVRLANQLGVESGYEITQREGDGNKTTVLTKEGAQGDTVIKVISLTGEDKYGQEINENYILVELVLKQTAGAAAYDYKEKLMEMYDDLGMKANTNVYLCSQAKGELTEAEIDTEIQNFMNEMDASIVERSEFDGIVCVYGYSRGISEYVYQDKNPVNVNIAFSYDEAEDVTYIHRAVPFVDRSF